MSKAPPVPETLPAATTSATLTELDVTSLTNIIAAIPPLLVETAFVKVEDDTVVLLESVLPPKTARSTPPDPLE